MGYEWFLATDDQYHDEVYRLLKVLEKDATGTYGVQAMERLEELKRLSGTR